MILRILRYFSYLLITRKIIQGARSALAPTGLIPHLIEIVNMKIQSSIRKAAFAVAGFVFLCMGSVYILFHSAAEYDQYGYLSMNAQKSVCLTLIILGFFLIYPSRKVLKKKKRSVRLRPYEQNPDPSTFTGHASAPTDRAIQLHNFFKMLNSEAGRLIEQTTRPPNYERPSETFRPEKPA